MRYFFAAALLGLLVAPVYAGTYSTAVLADSPVAYWDFAGGTATNLGSAGTALNGTAYNDFVDVPDVLSGTGVGGTGFDTGDGSAVFTVDESQTNLAQYVEVLDPGDNSALDFGAGDAMSIELWFNPMPRGDQAETYLIGKGRTEAGATDQNYSIRYRGSTNQISILARGSDDSTWLKWTGTLPGGSTSLAIAGEWQHLVFAHTWGLGYPESSSTAVYYNGVDITANGTWNEITEGFFGGDLPPLETNSPLWLGSTQDRLSSVSYRGGVDEVAIYNTMLSATQVQSHYDAAGYAGETYRNGDFEAATVDEAWIPYNGADGKITSPILAHTGLSATGLDPGSQAAYFSDQIIGSVFQRLNGTELQSEWQMGFLFAAEAPESSRTMHFGINNNAGTNNSDLGILMRIDPDGNLQAYGSGAWNTIGAGVIDFSIDADDNESLADAGDTLNVYSIEIVGDYTTTPNYDVYLSDANSATMTLLAEDVGWFFNTPEAGSAPESLIFCQVQAETAGGSYIIDNIYFGEQTPELPAGDANGDGKVDGSDVTILAGNWQKGVDDGQTASWGEGDFNGDGKVDGSDVTILAGNWQYGITAAAASVPEPSVLMLLFGGISMLLCARRRQA